MSKMIWKSFPGIAAMLVAFSLSAQSSVRSKKTNGPASRKPAASAKAPAPLPADLGKIKIDAEAGKPGAQVELGDAYLEHYQAREALTWYRAAAAQNSVEGKYKLGKLLLWGATRGEIAKPEQVPPQPAEGIQWIYSVATNGYTAAWREMARAKQIGTGCQTNLAEAYAWLLLAIGKDQAGRDAAETLVLQMPAHQIQAGKDLAREMNNHHWPALEITAAGAESNESLPLTINGISGADTSRLAIINGKTVGENETITLQVDKKPFSIKCLKINADSVLVSVEGEGAPRLLEMK